MPDLPKKRQQTEERTIVSTYVSSVDTLELDYSWVTHVTAKYSGKASSKGHHTNNTGGGVHAHSGTARFALLLPPRTQHASQWAHSRTTWAQDLSLVSRVLVVHCASVRFLPGEITYLLCSSTAPPRTTTPEVSRSNTPR